MDLNDFKSAFAVTSRVAEEMGPNNGPLGQLYSELGGTTFEHGLYRVHTPATSKAAIIFVAQAFPQFVGRIECFGFDWLGRQFAVDNARGTPQDPEVLLLEPGTGEALEIPIPFSRFHNDELVNFREEALAAGFFAEWRSSSDDSELGFTRCLGYQVPLFLGGRDTVENLEELDVEVYWVLLGQLLSGTRKMNRGSTLGELRIQN